MDAFPEKCVTSKARISGKDIRIYNVGTRGI